MKIFAYDKSYTILIIVFIAMYMFYQFVFKISPNLYGDGPEYFMMAQAVSNHFTPDIRQQDIADCNKISPNNNYLIQANDYLKKQHKFNDVFWGIYTAKNGKQYGYHFWFYSFISAPMLLLLKYVGSNPLKCFEFTNLLLILIMMFYILKYSKLENIQKIIAIVFFIFSSNAWYISWPHPEVFTSFSVFLSLLMFYDKRYYMSVLLAVLGSFQNPSVIFLIPFLLFWFICENKFKIKKIILLILISIIALLPYVFFYYNFNVPNLIVYNAKAINSSFLTFDRIFSLFFDLNQGMIVSIPLLLPFFIYFFIKKIILWKASRWYVIISYPLIIILMSIPLIQQVNWNMGASVVSRYTVWLSMLIIFFVIVEVDWNNKFNKLVILPILIISQIYIVIIMGGLNPDVSMYLRFNKLSKFIIEHHPSLYNPEYEIFGERVLNHEDIDENNSPIIYSNSNAIVSKIMVHKNTIMRLDSIGMNKVILDKYLKKLHFKHDWAYINLKKEDYFISKHK